MIKLETVGMIQRVVTNPILKAEKDVINNAVIVIDGETYLINNPARGDLAYFDGLTIPAGEFLNGYALSSLVGQKLVIDAKNIAGEAEVNVGDVLAPNADGLLAVGAGEGDLTFVVSDVDVELTEKKAVKAVITKA